MSTPLLISAEAACDAACGSNQLLIRITWQVATGATERAPSRNALAHPYTAAIGNEPTKPSRPLRLIRAEATPST